MEHIDALRNALDELVSQRDQLDEDIADLRRIIARRSGGVSRDAAPIARTEVGQQPRRSTAPAPGDARREILELMTDGKTWTPSAIAKQRGTSPNAASRALKRMLDEEDPPIRSVGYAKYRLASPKGDDEQGSLPVDAERDDSEAMEGGGS